MAEMNVNAQNTTPAVKVAYTIRRYENGDVDVVNADVEGAVKLGSEALYKDLEDVAEIIRLKRIENAAYSGVLRFYQSMQTQMDAGEPAPDIEI